MTVIPIACGHASTNCVIHLGQSGKCEHKDSQASIQMRAQPTRPLLSIFFLTVSHVHTPGWKNFITAHKKKNLHVAVAVETTMTVSNTVNMLQQATSKQKLSTCIASFRRPLSKLLVRKNYNLITGLARSKCASKRSVWHWGSLTNLVTG